MIRTSLLQFAFGLRVFFKRLSLKNAAVIGSFIFKRCLLRRRVPFSVVFALTYKCQCRCVHCSVADYGDCGPELGTSEAMRVIDEIAAWGPVKITFFGGEPLVRRDLVDLAAHAASRGLRTSLDTTGLLLAAGMAARLREAGIGNVNVSLDSADSAVHDSLRAKTGCFEAAVGAIKACVAAGIPCLVSTYASKRALKEKDLERLIALARELGASGVKVLFPILSGNWRRSEEERLSLEEEHYLLGLMDPSYVYLEDALQMVKRRGKGCSALERNLVYISPAGDVQPCPAIPVSFGNLREKPLSVIASTMERHPFFGRYGACSVCLMNDPSFRGVFFSKTRDRLPVPAEEFAGIADQFSASAGPGK